MQRIAFRVTKVLLRHAVRNVGYSGLESLSGESPPHQQEPSSDTPLIQPAAYHAHLDTTVRPDLPTTAETLAELKRRLAKELYRAELDLQNGGRIAGKPCDCLSKAKHLAGIEATAEELMSYEVNPLYGEVIDWFDRHANEFEPAEIIKRPPEYYQGLAPEIRNFRKKVMGTDDVMALTRQGA